MSATHTPGPWSLDLKNIDMDLSGHVSVDAPNHGALAQVVWLMADDKSLGRNSPMCEANARLIAAAPDLLASLQELLPMWSSGIEEPWVQRARDAIAKATGSPKKYQVTASYTVYCNATIEAYSQEQANAMAKDMDGGSFEVDPQGDDTDDWKIQSIVEVQK